MERVCATKVEGSRLIRTWDDNLQEWYVNDARGLEHGFTISHRPGGSEAMSRPRAATRRTPSSRLITPATTAATY